MPSPIYYKNWRLPASYANFYISNACVIVPTFNDVNDRVALGILGLDSADYSAGYITGWAERAEADVMRETAKRVLDAAQRISEILTPAPAIAHELAA